MHLCAGKNNFMLNIINHTKVHSGLYLLMQTGEQKKIYETGNVKNQKEKSLLELHLHLCII